MAAGRRSTASAVAVVHYPANAVLSPSCRGRRTRASATAIAAVVAFVSIVIVVTVIVAISVATSVAVTIADFS